MRRAKQKRRNMHKCLAFCLTSLFTGAALPDAAAAIPPPPPMPQKSVCVQTMKPHDTHYRNLDNFRMAAAYGSFMRERGQNPDALYAILEASEKRGVDFELMLIKAILESSLGKYSRPIHLKNGSARGLYQFMPATWLTLFSRFGERYNNGQYADMAKAIKFDDRKNPYVQDTDTKKKLLNLRLNHFVSAFIKAMQIKYEEHYVLRSILRHEPNLTDYYIVHFLGIPSARRFFDYLKNEPDKPAASILKREAFNNVPVFYRGGKPRSFSEIYDDLEKIIKNELKDIHDISDAILRKDRCTPPLQKHRIP